MTNEEIKKQLKNILENNQNALISIATITACTVVGKHTTNDEAFKNYIAMVENGVLLMQTILCETIESIQKTLDNIK